MNNETSVILIDRQTFQVQGVNEQARKMIDAALETSALIGRVHNATSQEQAVQAVANLKGMLKQIEDSRIAVKDGPWRLCQAIDAKAHELKAELLAEVERLAGRDKGLISVFQAEQRQQREAAERARLNELQRLENERLERESEANRVAQEAENKRQKELRAIQEAEAKAKTAKARAEFERQRAILEREREIADKEATLKREAQERLDAAERARLEKTVPMVPVLADGQKVKAQWDYEVTNIFDFLRAHPGCCKVETRRTETMDLINRLGMRTIPGLRVFEVHESQIAAAKPQKAINV